MNFAILVLLFSIRVVLNFTTTGYIHPDEYFQSVEILSNTIGINVPEVPWEWEPQLPARSIVSPYGKIIFIY